MDWISIKDREPPKDLNPFLAKTTYGIQMMIWIEKIVDEKQLGWFGFYCACSCCNGFCADEFTHWMPLPEPPKDE